MEDFYEAVIGGPGATTCFIVGHCCLIKLKGYDSLVVAIRVVIGICSRDHGDDPSSVES